MKLPGFSDDTPEDAKEREAKLLEDKRNQLQSSIEHLSLKRIAVEDFKVIGKYHDFHFAPLTLLTGQNSSGKSSLIELLKIFATNHNWDGLYLNELAEKIGSFTKVINKSNSSGEFSFSYDTITNSIREKLTVVAKYRASEGNQQQADIGYYKLETEEEVLLEFTINRENYASGYINFPALWKKFKCAFEHCLALKNNRGRGLVHDIGYIRGIGYYNSKNFFKGNEKQFVLKDFETFPLFYHANLIAACTPSLQEEFSSRYPHISKEDLINYERELFEIFYFEKFFLLGSRPIHELLKEIRENTFDLLISRNRKGFSSGNEVNPLLELLENSEYGKKVYYKREDGEDSHYYTSNLEKANFIYDLEYLRLKGMSEDDLTILSGYDNKFTKNVEYFYKKILSQLPISSKGKKLLDSIRRKDLLREEFCRFISEEITSTLIDNLPPAIFIPVNRSSQKIVQQNLGGRTSYSSFLQQSAVLYMELTYDQRKIIDRHIDNLIKIFEFGDSAAVITDEHGFLQLTINKGDYTFNIVEEGFGISQLFSMIIGICVQAISQFSDEEIFEASLPFDPYDLFETKPLMVAIEEPESNLHPNYQSKLADMFIYLVKEMKIQFVIETHSEYLIRRLRYLTALWYKDPHKGFLAGAPKELWKAYYFNRIEKVSYENPQIFEIGVVDDNGTLSRQFGPEFLDVATDSELEYLNLFNVNTN